MQLRQTLHQYVDTLPERKLSVLYPLLAVLAEDEFSIETDLTDEEKTLIKAELAEYQSTPETLVSLRDFQNGKRTY
ncbi:hypothetical protein FACS189443_7170 [Planctomycetales bacterium]|nr:hypothetical protein FACS189443_7170 [Planctomycetales bacterium]